VRDVRQRLAAGDPVVPHRARDTGLVTGDAAMLSTSTATAFSEWMAATAIDDGDWVLAVDEVPASRLYELADESARRAESWRRLAAALETRARRGTRRG
jgi:hypothetical protein